MSVDRKTEVLSYLYQLRVLEKTQILNHLFINRGVSKSFFYKVMDELVMNKMITETKVNKMCYYEIARRGVDYLRTNGIVYIGSTHLSKQADYLRPSELKVAERVRNHQVALNDFVLRFEQRFTDFSYYDEKFASFLDSIRPDGIIRVGDTLFFLEMDMGTERKEALKRKWEGYRVFINSGFFYELQQKICVLFILHSETQRTSRAHTLQTLIAPHLETKFSSKFNFMFGNEEKIMEYLEDTIGKNDVFPMQLKEYSRIDNYMSNATSKYMFDSYIFKTDCEGYVYRENGHPLEFLYDDNSYSSMYVYRKLKAFHDICTSFRNVEGRDIKYLILVRNELDAYKLLVDVGFFPIKVYFTTRERLLHNTLYSALFQIHKDGTIYHFANGDFGIPIVESRIGSFERKTS